MKNLEYFEKLAETVIFDSEKKKVMDTVGNDSNVIRTKLSNKENFTDATKIVSFKNYE